MITGIIPACGDATRMGGIAKFNLPLTKKMTIIDWHIKSQLKYCDNVIIVVNEKYENLLNKFKKNKKIKIIVTKTKTMSETVLLAINSFESDNYVVGMPDTYVIGENPYKKIIKNNIDSDINLGIFKIKENQKGKLGQVDIYNSTVIDCVDKSIGCNYKYSWGFIKFSQSAIKLIDKKDPHIGYIINKAIKNNYLIKSSVINGEYFDCGTLQEYQELLNKINN